MQQGNEAKVIGIYFADQASFRPVADFESFESWTGAMLIDSCSGGDRIAGTNAIPVGITVHPDIGALHQSGLGSFMHAHLPALQVLPKRNARYPTPLFGCGAEGGGSARLGGSGLPEKQSGIGAHKIDHQAQIIPVIEPVIIEGVIDVHALDVDDVQLSWLSEYLIPSALAEGNEMAEVFKLEHAAKVHVLSRWVKDVKRPGTCYDVPGQNPKKPNENWDEDKGLIQKFNLWCRIVIINFNSTIQFFIFYDPINLNIANAF